MLKEIIVWKSKAKLKETHHYLLKKRLEILMEQGLLKTIEDGSTIPTRRKQPLMATLVSTARTADLEVAAARGGRGGEGEEDGGDYGEEDEEDEETGENGEVASGGGSSKTARLRGGKEEEPILYEACMSPLLLDEIAHEDKKLDIVDEEEDYYELVSGF